MDELDKGLAVTITGLQREAALAACRRQMQGWGLAVPPAEPLVLDFGLGDFTSTGLIEYWIANEMSAGYCGKYLFLFDGQTCPRHRHKEKHETFFVVKGRVRTTLGERVFEMEAGEVLTVPPGIFHSLTGIGPALLLELSMPCKISDNEFADVRIPLGGESEESPQ